MYQDNLVIVPVQTINKSFIKSLNYALTIGDNVEVYHVSTDEEQTKKLIEKYSALGIAAHLIIGKIYEHTGLLFFRFLPKKESILKVIRKSFWDTLF